MFTIVLGIAVGLGITVATIWVLKNKTSLLSGQTTPAPVQKSEQQQFDEHIVTLQEQLGRDRSHLKNLQDTLEKNRKKIQFNRAKKSEIEAEVQSIASDPEQSARCEVLRKEYAKASNVLSSLTEEMEELQRDIATLEQVVTTRRNEIEKLKSDWEKLRARERTLSIQAQAGDAELGTGGPESRDAVLKLLEQSRQNNIALSARVNLNDELGASAPSRTHTVAESEFDVLLAKAKASKTEERSVDGDSVKE